MKGVPDIRLASLDISVAVAALKDRGVFKGPVAA
jgi:hypothetical protein